MMGDFTCFRQRSWRCPWLSVTPPWSPLGRIRRRLVIRTKRFGSRPFAQGLGRSMQAQFDAVSRVGQVVVPKDRVGMNAGIVDRQRNCLQRGNQHPAGVLPATTVNIVCLS